MKKQMYAAALVLVCTAMVHGSDKEPKRLEEIKAPQQQRPIKKLPRGVTPIGTIFSVNLKPQYFKQLPNGNLQKLIGFNKATHVQIIDFDVDAAYIFPKESCSDFDKFQSKLEEFRRALVVEKIKALYESTKCKNTRK